MTEGAVQLPLEITVRHTTLALAEQAMIRRCADRLPECFSRVRGCRVAVDAPAPRRGEHPKYTARVELALPAGAITIVEPPSEDRFTVIRGALDAAARQLQCYALHHRYQTSSRRTSI